MRLKKADRLGREFLLATAYIQNGLEPEREPKDIMLEAKENLIRADILEFNAYIRIVNTLQTLVLQANGRYADAAKELSVSYREITELAILLTAELDEVMTPIVMTAKQYEAWQNKEPETEEEQLLVNRANIYGVAIRQGNKPYMLINADGEYHRPDHLKTFKELCGAESFIADTPKAKTRKARHYQRKQETVDELLCVMRYNYFVDALAEATKVPELEYWKIDTDKLRQGIDSYNYIVLKLRAEVMRSGELLQLIKRDYTDQLRTLLNNELCRISPDLLEDIYSEEELESLANILEDFKTLHQVAADTLIITKTDTEDINLIKAAADLEAKELAEYDIEATAEKAIEEIIAEEAD